MDSGVSGVVNKLRLFSKYQASNNVYSGGRSRQNMQRISQSSYGLCSVVNNGRSMLIAASVDLVNQSTVMVKTTEQNISARFGNSEAEVSNNKRRRSRYCTVEVNYRWTQSMGPVCDRRASGTVMNVGEAAMMRMWYIALFVCS